MHRPRPWPVCIAAFIAGVLTSNLFIRSAVGQEQSLDGVWQFAPAEGAMAPASPTADALDAKARELGQDVGAPGKWAGVAVPQFLNRTVWWLSDVSLEYEAQETERIKVLPFHAEGVDAGWYVHDLPVLAAGPEQQEVYVCFEGVAMVSRVYCNGHFVGGHTGMFGSFECRLTPYMQAGGGNRLFVYVERGKPGDGAVVGTAVTMAITRDMFSSLDSGLFGGFGRGPKAKCMGIWQPVTLKTSQAGGRLADVFFNPALDGHTISCTIENPTDHAISGRLGYKVAAARTGAVLAEETPDAVVSVEASASKTLTMKKTGLSPQLWSPDFPNLYQLVVEWRSEAGKVIDSCAYRVGYRTVTTKGEQVYLNDHPYWVRGADMPPYGYRPNSEETARAFLQRMHDSNMVVTRAHGNPWNHLWFGVSDEVGVGVSAEGVRPWALMSKQSPPQQAILDHWMAEQLETVRAYRNHPSVLFYCISNEGLQGDADNPEKLAIFRQVIDAVRKLDPSRPIFQTSGDPDRQNIADLEDIHSYWGWYEPSSYVNDYKQPRNGLTLGDGRPFIDEEAAVPYQMIDSGGVHPSYLSKCMAQPWVGDLGTFGADPAYFTEHVRAEAKLKTEKLRYSRKELPTAGVMLFCASTWMQGALSRAATAWKPLPVWTAVARSMQPVLAALETEQSVFFAGSTLTSAVYVVNDDAWFRDLHGLKLTVDILDETENVTATQDQPLGDIPYFEVRKYPVQFTLPKPASAGERMVPATLRLRLFDTDEKEISSNSYPVRLATHGWTTRTEGKRIIAADGCNPEVLAALAAAGASVMAPGQEPADVLVLGPNAKVTDETTVQRHLKRGGRVLILEDEANEKALCPDAAAAADSVPGGKGEFVEMLGWTDHQPFFAGLQAMDWKWWAQPGQQETYVCRTAHSLDLSKPGLTALGRYLAPHFYWPGNVQQVYEKSVRYPVFAMMRDWGQIVVCDLTISESIALDPRAAKTLTNLVMQALP